MEEIINGDPLSQSVVESALADGEHAPQVYLDLEWEEEEEEEEEEKKRRRRRRKRRKRDDKNCLTVSELTSNLPSQPSHAQHPS